jgi:hypothetical protein
MSRCKQLNHDSREVSGFPNPPGAFDGVRHWGVDRSDSHIFAADTIITRMRLREADSAVVLAIACAFICGFHTYSSSGPKHGVEGRRTGPWLTCK